MMITANSPPLFLDRVSGRHAIRDHTDKLVTTVFDVNDTSTNTIDAWAIDTEQLTSDLMELFKPAFEVHQPVEITAAPLLHLPTTRPGIALP